MSVSTAIADSRAESGLQFLSRLEKRPSLTGLDNVIFEKGPFPNDVIEISGDASCGKTFLITQVLARCLLPKSYCSLDIGGLNAGAIIIDTDHHFQVLKLVSLMEAQIEHSYNSCSPRLHPATIENIIKEALNSLIILHCYDGIQLHVTFHNLRRILSNNKNVSLLVLDSISTFYWQNTLNNNGIRKIDTYMKKTLTSLQKHVQEFKVCTIYTRPSYFQSKIRDVNGKEGTCKYGKLTRQIHLQKVFSGEEELFSANIVSDNGKRVIPYRICDDGLKWHNCSESVRNIGYVHS